MNPPSEQLIRDYLNRLSLAAKTRLEPGDRQALLDDTRARIEAETAGVSKATAAQVRRILAALGDPIAVAENERARIAGPTDPAAGSRATGSIRQIWPPPGVHGIGYPPARAPTPMRPIPQPSMQPLPPRTANLPAAASRPAYPSDIRSGNGSVPLARSGLPRLAEPASSAGPSGSSGASGRAGPPGSGPRSPRAPRGLPPQRAPRGLPSPGTPLAVPPPRESPAPGNSPPPAISPPPASLQPGNSHAPDNPHDPAGEPAPPPGQSDQDKASKRATPGRDGTDQTSLDDQDEPGVEFSIELVEQAVYEEAGPSWLSLRAGAAVAGLRRFGSALVAIAARAPLESIAVLVLGIGGAIYPPIWFIGALLTALSRQWDLRDKWFGLAVPVLVVIVGATLAIVLGGQHASYGSYAFEAWLAAGRLSRIAAVLSAIYLLWRVSKGPRDPRRPPWSMPRRPG